MRLMEEILHHLTCMKPCKKMEYLPNQLVQDIFHQQYPLNFLGWKLEALVFSQPSGLRTWLFQIRICGHRKDTLGRKVAVVITVIGMLGATVGQGLLPTPRAWGEDSAMAERNLRNLIDDD